MIKNRQNMDVIYFKDTVNARFSLGAKALFPLSGN